MVSLFFVNKIICNGKPLWLLTYHKDKLMTVYDTDVQMSSCYYFQ